MKRLMALILAVIMTFSMVACGGDTGTEDTSSEPQQTEATPEPTPQPQKPLANLVSTEEAQKLLPKPPVSDYTESVTSSMLRYDTEGLDNIEIISKSDMEAYLNQLIDMGFDNVSQSDLLLDKYGEEKTVIFTATNSTESEIHLSVTFGGGKDNIAPKFYLTFEPK